MEKVTVIREVLSDLILVAAELETLRRLCLDGEDFVYTDIAVSDLSCQIHYVAAKLEKASRNLKFAEEVKIDADSELTADRVARVIKEETTKPATGPPPYKCPPPQQ